MPSFSSDADIVRPSSRPGARETASSELELSVRSGRDSALVSLLEIRGSKLARNLKRAKEESVLKADVFPDIEITLRSGSPVRTYRLERSGNLFDQAASRRLRLPSDLADRLLVYAKTLRAAHYGRLVPWSEARLLLPRKSFFTITDLESGLSFRVQRRAGSSHADVQPISKEDSAIMKQIYGGSWSWRRRAILVRNGRERIAASMNGMPHGGDGIPDNGFKGHFCVHFLNSTSHRSDIPDPAHQLMVYKATGDLRSYFDKASPRLLALSFIEALNQKDEEMLEQLWEDAPPGKKESIAKWMGSLQSVSVKARNSSRRSRKAEPVPDRSDALSEEIKIPAIFRGDRIGTLHAELEFKFSRASSQAPWRFEDVVSSHSSLIP